MIPFLRTPMSCQIVKTRVFDLEMSVRFRGGLFEMHSCFLFLCPGRIFRVSQPLLPVCTYRGEGIVGQENECVSERAFGPSPWHIAGYRFMMGN
ncbi:hypothetical protein L249_6743 [Ophiocordyceps polyrhachis-furcata BCC 54312]|uniref:Uncharacterized protein n=1 Tax=Ophiocordyceps polyrhachis-furcata BCC 54312 TaxID=1330021 RepID=A0A367LKD9_9HYPO|nr:hypothetical protein L249_6743 [Ophiocordyceps polyrhachis-furcata BCC 54312]